MARQLLREALAACGREDWRDAAELALTELTTNAVLHAVTDVEIRIICGRTELRVEVGDGSTAVPQQRAYGATASTGRGLGMVAAVAQDHGFTRTERGKVVWFTLGDAPADTHEESFDAGLDAWVDDDDEFLAPSSGDLPTVTLAGFPPLLWRAALEMQDALLRELALYRAGRGLDTSDLAAADRARFAVRAALDNALAGERAKELARDPLPTGHPASLEHCPPALDLEVPLSPGLAGDAAMLQDVLDEANRLAADGQLLTRPSLPEVVALRDWAAEQIISSASGQAPMAWSGVDGERFTQDLDRAARDFDYDVHRVVDGPRTAIVIDSGNRVLGISSTLAAAIGWDPDDLIGRRVVAIVPPRFREAHVSGFTRHLSTGQAHALRVPLRLPVLCADGSELVCDFWIDDDHSQSGQPVYIALVSAPDKDAAALR